MSRLLALLLAALVLPAVHAQPVEATGIGSGASEDAATAAALFDAIRKTCTEPLRARGDARIADRTLEVIRLDPAPYASTAGAPKIDAGAGRMTITLTARVDKPKVLALYPRVATALRARFYVGGKATLDGKNQPMVLLQLQAGMLADKLTVMSQASRADLAARLKITAVETKGGHDVTTVMHLVDASSATVLATRTLKHLVTGGQRGLSTWAKTRLTRDVRAHLVAARLKGAALGAGSAAEAAVVLRLILPEAPRKTLLDWLAKQPGVSTVAPRALATHVTTTLGVQGLLKLVQKGPVPTKVLALDMRRSMITLGAR